MEKQEFDRRVEKYMAQIESAPGLYKARVLGFAMFGYVVYAFMMLATLAILVAMVALLVFHPNFLLIKLGLKLGIPVLVLVIAMIASLKVGGYMPQGIPIKPEDAPELFRDLDAMRERLRVPKLSRVLLTDDYNAGVVQQTRFGFFGGDSILLLGLPLMQAISPRDLKVVLAHELGHLSRNHSRMSGWVYRAVGTYVQLLQATGTSTVIEGFLNWYVPRLDALSFPLRRKNEYEADAAAAELHGRERTAQVLANVRVRGSLLPEFWQGVFKKVVVEAHPPAQLFHEWAKESGRLRPEGAETALKDALGEKTDTDDTHPCLADRVQALGGEVVVEAWPEHSAAQAYLGEQYEFFVQQAGFHWSSQVASIWEQQHGEVLRKKNRLAQLEGERKSRKLTADEAFEYADIAEDVLPDQDPLPLFEAVLELYPEHDVARFSVGRLLVLKDDDRGVPLLEGFSDHKSPNLRLASASLLAEYYARQKDQSGADRAMKAAQRAAEEQGERERARAGVRMGDKFEPHELDASAVQGVTLALALIREVKTAYLVRKVVDDEGPPIYVLAFERRTGFFQGDEGAGELPERISSAISLPGEYWVLSLEQNGGFRRPMKAVPGAEIYSL